MLATTHFLNCSFLGLKVTGSREEGLDGRAWGGGKGEGNRRCEYELACEALE